MVISIGPILRPFSERSVAGEGIIIDPKLVPLSGGGQVLVWGTRGTNDWFSGVPAPDSDYGIHAQIFSEDGRPSVPFVVYSGTDRPGQPLVLPQSDGGFLVSWSQNRLIGPSTFQTEFVSQWGQRYSADGATSGERMELTNADTEDTGLRATALIGLDIGFALIWSADSGADQPARIFAQTFDDNGVPTADSFVVGAANVSSGEYAPPAAVALRDGGFAIAWSAGPLGGTNSEIVLRLYDDNGIPRGPAFPVTDTPNLIEENPVLVELLGGGLLLGWQAPESDGSWTSDLFARSVTSDGTSLSEVFSIPLRQAGTQHDLQFSLWPDGHILATWVGSDLITRTEDNSRWTYPSSSVLGRVLSADGTQLGGEFHLLHPETNLRINGYAQTAMPDGNAITTIVDYGIYVDRYSTAEWSELGSRYFEPVPGVVGTVGNDELVGGTLSEFLRGLDGDDLGYGNEGDDTLEGGPGSDTLFGGDGNDLINGGPALLETYYGAPPEQFEGLNKLHGGDGDDLIHGGDLRDEITGGAGADEIHGYLGNDLIYGQDGNDTITGGWGLDELIGQEGDDIISGGPWSDLLFGGPGDDFVNGGFGHDRINGGTGADKFFHLGTEGHGSDWVQDYNAAEGDVLLFDNASATRDQFQVNFAHTENAEGERSGDDSVQEAFVIYRPTGQIMWALVDGGGQSSINLQIGDNIFDLLA